VGLLGWLSVKKFFCWGVRSVKVFVFLLFSSTNIVFTVSNMMHDGRSALSLACSLLCRLSFFLFLLFGKIGFFVSRSSLDDVGKRFEFVWRCMDLCVSLDGGGEAGRFVRALLCSLLVFSCAKRKVVVWCEKSRGRLALQD
jgi:hypothetical protein